MWRWGTEESQGCSVKEDSEVGHRKMPGGGLVDCRAWQVRVPDHVDVPG